MDDWKISNSKPDGTFIKDNVMNSPMIKNGEDYVITLNLPEGTVIDYIFEFKRNSGPFRFKFNYLDMNIQGDTKYYHTVIKGNMVIRHSPDIKKLQPLKFISTFKYSVIIFVTISLLATSFFIWKKYRIKNKVSPKRPEYAFVAITFSLLSVLILIRALITGLAVQFLANPVSAFPLIFKTSYHDFLYVAILSLVFGILFWTLRMQRIKILWVYGAFAALSIIIATANVKVTEMIGRPFSYQWLYYSDFLKSTDAMSALSANLEKKTIVSLLLMCISSIPLAWLIYLMLQKKPFVIFSIFGVCFLLGIFATNDNIYAGRKANPVIHFLSSFSSQSGLNFLSSPDRAYKNEFIIKNPNVIKPLYSGKFPNSKVKNVIIFVLESTPAEYLTPYKPQFKTTPFLDSLKGSSALFDAFYAHAPGTNKSLVSILCGAYPYLSFKAITAEKPGIKWPSISSELKKAGYRTSYFNSGDNRFQGAENFLSNRGFDIIEDYRTNTCGTETFTDSRFSKENLEGSKDSCLSVKFFNWLGNDVSKPFFSMMWTYQTHYPYFPSNRNIDFKTGNLNQEKYLNALRQADESLKQLVEGLQQRHLLESTLIVILGDHGEAFGRHGQTTHAGGIFEENIHIPLMLINSTLFSGERITDVGGICDIAPTIFSVLNKPIPDEWQGENLFSLNRKKKVYFFSPYSDYLFGCREGDYKYIFNASTNEYALYNLKIDPYETTNLASKNTEYLEQTKKHVNAWIHYQGEFVSSYLNDK